MSILQSRRQRVVKAGTRIDSITNSGNNATINAALTPGHLFGMTMTPGTDATNDINFAAGSCRDSTDAKNLIGTALVKQLDVAWAVGTNAGGRMSAAAIANTTYHCFAILKDSDLSVDYGMDVSATAPTMPTGYTYFRRIGSIIRAGATILAFIQDGDQFRLAAPVADISATNPGTSAVTRAMTVPLGIRVEALIAVYTSGSTAAGTPAAVYISDLSLTDVAASSTTTSFASFTTAVGRTDGGAQVRCFTDTSAQVRSRLQISAAGTSLFMSSLGWTDTRGRAA